MNRKRISWLLLILWMAFIFYLSHQPVEVSNNLSKGITEKVVEIVEKVSPDKSFDLSRANHLIRKNAHFFAYLLLGVLVSNALRSSGFLGYKAVALALLICVLYAISDEIHQLYVPGRGGQLKDVVIDGLGSMVGIAVFEIINLRRRKNEIR